jgi:hypothetical protein
MSCTSQSISHPPPLNFTPPLKCRLKLDDDIKIPRRTQMPSAAGEHNGDVEGVATRLELKGFNFRFPFSFPGFRVWVEGLPVSGRSLSGVAMAPLKPQVAGGWWRRQARRGGCCRLAPWRNPISTESGLYRFINTDLCPILLGPFSHCTAFKYL